MVKKVDVLVYWTIDKKQHLPRSETYSTIAKFAEDAECWPFEAWSVVLEFDSIESVANEGHIARARFLANDAPIERLMPGRVFELYEGIKKVATVKVI